MSTDHRYILVREMINSGGIKTFGQIFIHIPKSVVARDLGIRYDTFERRLENPRSLNIGELFKLARLLDCSPCILLNIFGPTKTGEE